MKIELTAKVLFDIINNTRNPKLAMELIDGTYQQLELPKTVRLGKAQTPVTLVSYDKWSNQVTYQHPTGEIETMLDQEWLKLDRNFEDVSVVLPKDIKILEAMHEQK